MITGKGIREKKSAQNKEEKMNARKVLSVVCALVVGLAALGSSALAEPPALEYTWWNEIYDYELPNNFVPLVTWPKYEYTDPPQLGGYDPWDPIGNSFAVAVSLSTTAVERVWDDYGLPNDTMPLVTWPKYEYSDPAQLGGYDPWDPIGNAFAVAVSLQMTKAQVFLDADGCPDNIVQVVPWPTIEWSDPRQLGGYDPWGPIGDAFGVR